MRRKEAPRQPKRPRPHNRKRRTTMHYEIPDLTKARKQLAELKPEVTSPDEVHEPVRKLYRRELDAGPFKLDAAFRDQMVANLDRDIAKEKTEGELAALRREKDAALVWD